jgi:hypothetical protein
MVATLTEAHKARLRRQLDLTPTALPDAEIEDTWAEAAERYSGYADNALILYAVTRLQLVRDLMVKAAKTVSYTQNDSSDDLSDVMKHLRSIESMYQRELNTLIDDEDTRPTVRWGSMTGKPSRPKGYPNA